MAEQSADKSPVDTDASFKNKQPPSAEFVTWLLANANAQNPNSPLHRLGIGEGDASAGNHTHDGRNSRAIIPGTAVNGNLATDLGQRQAIKGIINVLVKLGAVDGTTG